MNRQLRPIYLSHSINLVILKIHQHVQICLLDAYIFFFLILVISVFPTLTKFINDYGDQEDIASLLTMCINNHEEMSMVSTMTKKLYLTSVKEKSYQQLIINKLNEMQNDIEKINQRVRGTES